MIGRRGGRSRTKQEHQLADVRAGKRVAGLDRDDRRTRNCVGRDGNRIAARTKVRDVQRRGLHRQR